MANTNAPFGFQQYFGGSGGVPTFNQTTRRIASNAGAIYNGDPVMPVIGTATGYIVQGSPGTTVLAGIFSGCKYLSVSQKRTVWSNYWPGSDANGDVEATLVVPAETVNGDSEVLQEILTIADDFGGDIVLD